MTSGRRVFLFIGGIFNSGGPNLLYLVRILFCIGSLFLSCGTTLNYGGRKQLYFESILYQIGTKPCFIRTKPNKSGRGINKKMIIFLFKYLVKMKRNGVFNQNLTIQRRLIL